MPDTVDILDLVRRRRQEVVAPKPPAMDDQPVDIAAMVAARRAVTAPAPNTNTFTTSGVADDFPAPHYQLNDAEIDATVRQMYADRPDLGEHFNRMQPSQLRAAAIDYTRRRSESLPMQRTPIVGAGVIGAAGAIPRTASDVARFGQSALAAGRQIPKFIGTTMLGLGGRVADVIEDPSRAFTGYAGPVQTRLVDEAIGVPVAPAGVVEQALGTIADDTGRSADVLQKMLPQDVTTPYTPAWFANQIGAAVPQMAGTMAMAAAGGAVGGIPGAFAAAAGPTFLSEGGQQASQIYQTLKSQGANEDEALASAFVPSVVTGAINASVELLGPEGQVARKILSRQIGTAVRQIAKSAVQEGGEEVIQGAVSDLAGASATGETPDLEEMIDRRIQEFAVGSVMGGGMGAAVRVIPNMPGRRPQNANINPATINTPDSMPGNFDTGQPVGAAPVDYPWGSTIPGTPQPVAQPVPAPAQGQQQAAPQGETQGAPHGVQVTPEDAARAAVIRQILSELTGGQVGGSVGPALGQQPPVVVEGQAAPVVGTEDAQADTGNVGEPVSAHDLSSLTEQSYSGLRSQYKDRFGKFPMVGMSKAKIREALSQASPAATTSTPEAASEAPPSRSGTSARPPAGVPAGSQTGAAVAGTRAASGDRIPDSIRGEIESAGYELVQDRLMTPEEANSLTDATGDQAVLEVPGDQQGRVVVVRPSTESRSDAAPVVSRPTAGGSSRPEPPRQAESAQGSPRQKTAPTQSDAPETSVDRPSPNRTREPWEMTREEQARADEIKNRAMRGEPDRPEDQEFRDEMQRRFDLRASATPQQAAKMSHSDWQKWAQVRRNGTPDQAMDLAAAAILRGDDTALASIKNEIYDRLLADVPVDATPAEAARFQATQDEWRATVGAIEEAARQHEQRASPRPDQPTRREPASGGEGSSSSGDTRTASVGSRSSREGSSEPLTVGSEVYFLGENGVAASRVTESKMMFGRQKVKLLNGTKWFDAADPRITREQPGTPAETKPVPSLSAESKPVATRGVSDQTAEPQGEQAHRKSLAEHLAAAEKYPPSSRPTREEAAAYHRQQVELAVKHGWPTSPALATDYPNLQRASTDFNAPQRAETPSQTAERIEKYLRENPNLPDAERLPLVRQWEEAAAQEAEASVPERKTASTPGEKPVLREPAPIRAQPRPAAPSRAESAPVVKPDLTPGVKPDIGTSADSTPKWGVYRVNTSQGERFAVRQSDKAGGFGDTLHKTEAEARQYAKDEQERDAKNAEFREKENSARAEKDAKDAALKADREDLDGFTDGMPAFPKARAVKVLNSLATVGGSTTYLKSHIRGMVKAGNVTLETSEEPKIKPMSRTAFNRASQREQDAHERKMKEAGTKTVYRVNGYDLGKIAYDYAKFLNEKSKSEAQTLSDSEMLRRLQSVEDKANGKGYEPLSESESNALLQSGLVSRKRGKLSLTDAGRSRFNNLRLEERSRSLREAAEADERNEREQDRRRAELDKLPPPNVGDTLSGEDTTWIVERVTSNPDKPGTWIIGASQFGDRTTRRTLRWPLNADDYSVVESSTPAEVAVSTRTSGSGQTGAQGNVYGAGKDIIRGGMAAGERMTRAEKIHDASDDPAVKTEALAVWNGINDGSLSPERADARLDAIEQTPNRKAPDEEAEGRTQAASLLNKSDETNPGSAEVEPGDSRLTAAAFRSQLEAVSKSKDEADAAYALVEARAEAAGESVDEYVGRRIAGIRNSSSAPEGALEQGTLNTDTPAFRAWFKDSKVVGPDGKPLVVYHGTNQGGFEVFEPTRPTDVVRVDGKEVRTLNYYDHEYDNDTDWRKIDPQAYHFGALADITVFGDAKKALEFRERESPNLDANKHSGDARHRADLRRLIGKKIERSTEPRPTGDGSYFATNTGYNFIHGSKAVYPVYLSIKNPIRLNASEIEGAGWSKKVEKYKAQGYDGAIFSDDKADITKGGWSGHAQIVAFSPTQIKSVNNRGTFDAGDPNILHQAAYHGSPHTFDKFSTSKIGTGEGAQAYGYGLYFAGNKEVADYYRSKLSSDLTKEDWKAKDGTAMSQTDVQYAVANDLTYEFPDHNKTGLTQQQGAASAWRAIQSMLGGSTRDAALQSAKSDIDKKAVEFLYDGYSVDYKEHKGRLYHVDLKPAEDEYLLWDRPLSEQSEKVRKAIGNAITIEDGEHGRIVLLGYNDILVSVTKGHTDDEAKDAGLRVLFGQAQGDNTGESAYRRFNRASATLKSPPSDEAASSWLKSLGIRGIKYLDGTSRQAKVTQNAETGKWFVTGHPTAYDTRERAEREADKDRNYNYVLFSDEDVEITRMEQAKKGAIEFLADGRAIIHVFETGDISTLVHELGHRFIFDLIESAPSNAQAAEDLAVLEQWAGVVDGKWTRPAHEKAARGFERYLRSGMAPSKELRAVFAKFKEWLSKIYAVIKGSPIDVTIPAEMRKVYDRLLVKEEKAASAVAPREAKRSRPRNAVVFDKPIVGKTGAKLTGYQWMWKMEEQHDKEGEIVERRVSDWDESQTNEATGREIVHQFSIERTDGIRDTVSLETALREMGYLNTPEGKQLRNVASSLKTLARNKMELAAAESDYAPLKAAKDEADAMRFPADKIEMTLRDPFSADAKARGERRVVWSVDGIEVVGEFVDAGKSPPTRVPDERRQTLEYMWRDAQAAKIAGKDAAWIRRSYYAQKIHDLTKRIAKQEKQIGVSDQVEAGRTEPVVATTGAASAQGRDSLMPESDRQELKRNATGALGYLNDRGIYGEDIVSYFRQALKEMPDGFNPTEVVTMAKAIARLNGNGGTVKLADMAEALMYRSKDAALEEAAKGDAEAQSRAAQGRYRALMDDGGSPMGQRTRQVLKEAGFIESNKYIPPRGVTSTPAASKDAAEVSDLPGFSVSPDDLPMREAVAAHHGTSHTPESRGQMEQREYVRHMEAVRDQFLPRAKTPEQRAALADELNRYKAGYLQHLRAWLSARSRVMSSMITGPANFPVASNQKKGETASRRGNELIEWSKKAQSAITRKLFPEAASSISSDNENAPDLLRAKIADAERLQEAMKQANNIVRDKSLTDDQKIAQLSEIGFEGSRGRELLKPDFAKRVGFPSYALQNNLANIKRMKDRVAGLERTASRSSNETEFTGGKIVDNAEENRVQIVFDSKPSPEVIAQLKGAAFKWAPSQGAWQRLRTDNAVRAAQMIAEKIGGVVDRPVSAQPALNPRSTTDTPTTFKDLQARARELGVPDKGVRKAIERRISAAEAKRAAQNAGPHEPTDTIAGTMTLDEFEAKGYSPDEVTRAEWVEMQRKARRSLGQSEEDGTAAAPYAAYEEYHREAVKRARDAGEEIDERVLADYPEYREREAEKTAGPVSVSFHRPPPFPVRKRLKEAGFRWDADAKAWTAPRSTLTEIVAKQVDEERQAFREGRQAAPTAETPAAAAPTPATAQRNKAAENAAKLRKVAESKRDAAREKLEQDRNTNTARRARMAAGVEADARRALARAELAIKVAEAQEAGTAGPLVNISNFQQVEQLLDLTRKAKYEAWKSLTDAEKSKYAGRADDGGNYIGLPVDDRVLDQVAFVKNPTIHSANYRTFIEKVESLPRSKAAAQELRRWRSYDDTLVRVTESNVEMLGEWAAKLTSRDAQDVSEAVREYRRYEAIRGDNENQHALRDAVKKLDELRGGVKQAKADPIKEMERELAGRRDIGVDFFPTPKDVAERVVSDAGVSEGMRVLEPSAGNGHIADAAKAAGGDVDVVETSDALRKILEAKGYAPVARDFMEYDPGAVYDRIVMNPPFSGLVDIDHVKHAYDLLKPGGRVVAIMSESPFFRADKKATGFREWLDELGGTSEQLPSGTFDVDQRGLPRTSVASRIVTIDKSESSAEAPAPPQRIGGEAGARLVVEHLQQENAKVRSNEAYLREQFGNEAFEEAQERGWILGTPEPSISRRTIATTVKGRAAVAAPAPQESTDVETEGQPDTGDGSEPGPTIAPVPDEPIRTTPLTISDEHGPPIDAAELDPSSPAHAARIVKAYQGWYDRTSGGGDPLDAASKRAVDAAYRTVATEINVPKQDANVRFFALPGHESEIKAAAEKITRIKDGGEGPPVDFAKPPSILSMPAGRPTLTVPAAKTLAQKIASMQAMAATETTRYAMNGVLVAKGGSRMVVTDGRRLAMLTGTKGEFGSNDGLYSFGKGGLGPVMEGNFPPYEDIVPKYDADDLKGKSASVESNKARRDAQRVALMTDEESRGVVVVLNTDGTLGFAAASAGGMAEVNVHDGYTYLGAANPAFLADAFEFAERNGDTHVEFEFPKTNKPIVFKGFWTTTVLMPVNMPKEFDTDDAIGTMRNRGDEFARVSKAKQNQEALGLLRRIDAAEGTIDERVMKAMDGTESAQTLEDATTQAENGAWSAGTLGSKKTYIPMAEGEQVAKAIRAFVKKIGVKSKPKPKTTEEKRRDSSPPAGGYGLPWDNATFDDEHKWYGTRVRVAPELKGEEAWSGIVERVHNEGRLVEVRPDGVDTSFRVPSSRITLEESGGGASSAPRDPNRSRFYNVLEDKIDALKTARNRQRIGRGRDTGSTTLFSDIVTAAQVAVLRAVQAGDIAGRALTKHVAQAIADLKSKADPAAVRKVAKAILKELGISPSAEDIERVFRRFQDQTRPRPKASRSQVDKDTGVSRPEEATITRGEAEKIKYTYAAKVAKGVYREATATTVADFKNNVIPKIRQEMALNSLARQGAAFAAGEKNQAKADKFSAQQAKAIKKTLVAEIRKLPPVVRGKFLAHVRDVRNYNQLRDALDAIDREAMLFDARLSMLLAKRIGSEKAMRLLPDEDENGVRVREEAAKWLRDAKTAWEDIQAEAENQGKPPKRKIGESKDSHRQRVRQHSIDSLGRMRDLAGQIKDNVDAVQSLQHYEKSKHVAYVKGQKVKAAVYRKEMADAAAKNAKPITSDDETETVNPGFIRRAVRYGVPVYALAKRIDAAWDGSGRWFHVLVQNFLDADRRKIFTMRDIHHEAEKVAESAGYKSIGDAHARLSGTFGKRYQEKVTVTVGGKPIQIPKGHAMDIWAHATDLDTSDLLARGQTINFRRNRVAKAQPVDVASVYRALTPTERKFVEDMKRVKDTLFKEMDATHRRLKGVSLDRQPGHWSRVRNTKMSEKLGQTDGWRNIADFHLDNSGFLKRRTGGRVPILVGDFLEGWNRQTNAMLQFTYMAEPIRWAEQLAMHPDVKPVLQRHYGDGMVRRLERGITDAGGTSPFTELAWYQRVVRSLVSRTGRALTSLNRRSWAKQLGGVAKIMHAMPMDVWQHGVRGAFKKGLLSRMTTHSADFWHRYNSAPHSRFTGVHDEFDALEGGRFKESMGKALGNLFHGSLVGADASLQQALNSIKISNAFDSVPARVAWAGWEWQVNKDHPTWTDKQKMEWVADKAWASFAATQNTTGALDSGAAYSFSKRDPLFGTLTQFTSDASKSMAMLYEAAHQGGAQRAKTVSAIGLNAAWASAVVGVGGSLLYAAIASLFGGEPDWEKSEEKAIADAERQFVQDIAGIVPMASPVMDRLRASSRGWRNSSAFENPVTGTIDQVLAAFGDIADAISDGESARSKKTVFEKVWAAAVNGAKAAATAEGLPVSPIVTDIEGVAKSFRGE